MTLLFAGIATLVSIVLAGFAAAVGDASARDMKAQTAADAAALAAAAEGAPYGRGLAPHLARRYAEMNGATLVSCDCDGTTVEVVVAADGVVAEAAAEIDPAMFAPLVVPAAGDGLHPRLAAAVATLLEHARGALRVESGFRSAQRQEELWSNALARYGSADLADDWVARPGHSMHERGLAVDLAGDHDLALRLIADLGLPLYRPLPHEPWHFELAGSRSSSTGRAAGGG